MTWSTPLAARVAAFIADSATDEFDAVARAVFAHQYEHLEVVRRLADALGRTPDTIERWQDIPAVPARAFKRYRMFAGADVAHSFASSGTSGAPRSQAHFSDEGLALMTESIVHNARRYLLPDGRATVILVLAPSPALAPPMIMAWGMARLIEHFGLEGSRFLVGAEGLDQRGLMRTLHWCTAEHTPVTLIGASFGFVHLLDGLSTQGVALSLPDGSRLMDAGGFKGRSRVVTRDDLDEAIRAHLGIPAQRSVNLLGMTELASQFYDGVLDVGCADNRRKQNAHWTKTVVCDPRTMESAAPGEPGLLCHWDLANIERPVAVLTDDMGTQDEHGWTVLGRAKGAESKGCSLTVDELLRGGR